jgi:IS1 family transposase
VYRLAREDQIAVAHLLCEGNSVRSVERLTGVHRDTILRLLVRVGARVRRMLDVRIHGLNLWHLQCDEIWTFVFCKQHRLPDGNCPEVGDQYLFVALDQGTKLVPSFLIGKRTAANAQAFMLDLSRRIITPPSGAPRPRPQISTDGFTGYPYAVDLAFADTVDYGMLIKDYQESEQPGRYGPPELVATQRRPVTSGLDPFAICTSHVERNNLSIRQFLRRFTRLTLGFSKKLANLEAAVALHVAHYNFCRFHATIRSTPAVFD